MEESHFRNSRYRDFDCLALLSSVKVAPNDNSRFGKRCHSDIMSKHLDKSRLVLLSLPHFHFFFFFSDFMTLTWNNKLLPFFSVNVKGIYLQLGNLFSDLQLLPLLKLSTSFLLSRISLISHSFDRSFFLFNVWEYR